MSNTEGVLKEAGTLLFARAHEFTSIVDEIHVFFVLSNNVYLRYEFRLKQ